MKTSVDCPQQISPLMPLLIFYGLCLALFTSFRAGLLVGYVDRIAEVPHYLLIFPIGIRMDTIVLCYTLIVPALALLLLPARLVRKGAWLLSLYFAIIAATFCFMEVATFPFMAEFDTRPDRLFIEHMVQVREVFSMILKGYAANLAAGITGMALVATGMFLLMHKLLPRTAPCSLKKRLFWVFVPLNCTLKGLEETT